MSTLESRLPPLTAPNVAPDAALFDRWQRQADASARRATRQAAPHRPVKRRCPREMTNRLAAWLPRHVAADRRLTPATLRVLAVLVKSAENLISDRSVKEIADRAHCSPRAVQYAFRDLQALGYLTIEERRISATRNDTNIYRLAPRLFEKGEGAKNSGAQRGFNPSQSTYDMGPRKQHGPAEKERALAGRVRPDRKRCKAFQGEDVTPAAVESSDPPAAVRRRLLEIAAAAVPLLQDKVDPPKSEADLWQLAATLRARHIPAFNPHIWRKGQLRHGLRAALAVIETVLQHQAGQIRSAHGPAAYLYGILNQPHRAAWPDITLARWAAARSPGLANVAARPQVAARGTS